MTELYAVPGIGSSPTKTVVVYSPMRFQNEAWLPVLWSQAKTYYEAHGVRQSDWVWAPCYADIYADDFALVQQSLEQTPPDVFAVSLYVWNYWLGHRAAAWVKSRWPHCIVITGGPHQYFQHDSDWFRNYPYIDASLAGDRYGELCFQEILDNIDNNGKLDFNLVTDLWYPSKSRHLLQSKKQSSTHTRKNFDYNWPSVARQQDGITDYVNYAKKINQETKLLCVLETTRGCPYGCTYCDWGGGISTNVLKKDVDAVFQDIDFLCSLDLKYLYLADANFGIFKNRDVDIMQYLVLQRRRTNNKLKVGYGGFAKTENRLDDIIQILKIDIDNDLSNNREIKISMQSLDDQVLFNIDRKNIDLNKQLTALGPLSHDGKIPIYVEMILGLPGMTLDKFYRELNILGSKNLSVLWFEWLLLPETPAYRRNYRQHHKIVTIKKVKGWATPQEGSESDIVISTSSYNSNDYLEMLISTSWYHAFVRGGLFKNSLDWIVKHNATDIGDVIRLLNKTTKIVNEVQDCWQEILADPGQPCIIKYDTRSVHLGYYAVAKAFFEGSNWLQKVGNCLHVAYGVPTAIIKRDIDSTVTAENINCTKNKKWSWKSLNQNSSWNTVINKFYLYQDSGYILKKETKKFFWIF